MRKSTANRPSIGLLGLLLWSPYDQGQLTEVPLNFEIFAIKVVGQIIYACSTSKKSKL